MADRLVAGVTTVTVGRGVTGEIVDGGESLVVLVSQPGSEATAEVVENAIAGRGISVVGRVLPDGESAKDLSIVEAVTGWMADVGAKRDTTLIAVGGGALTDAAGFIASVFMRGIEARYVPTTLLGAIDAAIGGKTAVNVGGKNLVGTFAHPSRVVIDIDVLEALPKHLVADGMAEAVKAGFIGDERLVTILERPEPDLMEVVERAIAVKVGVVEQDFTEAGVRAHLNFGHTIGHAVEVLAGWSHGRSVAVGMVAAGEISARLCGFSGADRITAAIEGLGLPTRVDGLDRSEVASLMSMDKKSDSVGLRMVLLEDFTRPLVSHVDTATLDFGLDAIGLGEK
jgi:3-dehydroquinate synthetase